MEYPQGALAITGWGIISPIGIGVENFTRAFSDAKSGLKPLPRDIAATGPVMDACSVSDFDINEHVGPRGTRCMDRTTAMAVAAAGMALEHGGVRAAGDSARIGIVLGTTTGSIKSIADFTRETHVQERPYLVNPALFPNTVMNCAAGQSAIWHKLKGMNATISGGHLSALLALKYASLAIRKGYSDVLLTGAVEELCEQSAWAFQHTRPEAVRTKRPLGEGCGVFMVEDCRAARTRNRKVVAEILAFEVGVFPGANGNAQNDQAHGLARCMRRVIERAGMMPQDISVVSLCARAVPELDKVEEQALAMVMHDKVRPERFDVSELVGDCMSAAGVFQLAALLAHFAQKPERGRVGLMTCVGSDGHVGCALVRGVE